jgi:hypothetical protein
VTGDQNRILVSIALVTPFGRGQLISTPSRCPESATAPLIHPATPVAWTLSDAFVLQVAGTNRRLTRAKTLDRDPAVNALRRRLHWLPSPRSFLDAAGDERLPVGHRVPRLKYNVCADCCGRRGELRWRTDWNPCRLRVRPGLPPGCAARNCAGSRRPRSMIPFRSCSSVFRLLWRAPGHRE